jgi:hypothetical protein
VLRGPGTDATNRHRVHPLGVSVTPSQSRFPAERLGCVKLSADIVMGAVMKRGSPPLIALCGASVFVTVLNGAWILPQMYVGGYEPILIMGNVWDVLAFSIFLLSAVACYSYVLLAIMGYIEGVLSLCVVACAACALFVGWQRLFSDPSLVYKTVWFAAGQLSPFVILLNIIVVVPFILFWRRRIATPRGAMGGASTES